MIDTTPSLAEVIAPDYSAISRSIADTIAQVTKPLTNTQRTLLAASLGVWCEKLIAEARTSAASLRDEDAEALELLREATFHDGRYGQMEQAGWQRRAQKLLRDIDAPTQPAAQERQA